MKNKYKKMLVASLGILFFIGGLQNVRNIESMQLQVFVPENLSCTGTEAKQFVEDFQEQYQTEIAVCMLNKKTTAENTILENTVEAEEVRYAGIPDLAIRGGNYIQEDGEKLCYIDKNTASELYGSMEIKGQKITLDGTEYTIERVLSNATPMIAAPMDDDILYEIDEIRIRKNNQMSMKMLEQTLEVQYGITGKCMNIEFLVWLNKLVFAFGIALAFLLLLKVSKETIECRNKTVEEWGKYIVTGLIVCALIFIVCKMLAFPSSMTMHKISEFELWKEEFYQLKEDWHNILRLCNSSVMVEIMDSFIKAFLYGGGVITAFGYLNGMEEMGISKRGD